MSATAPKTVRWRKSSRSENDNTSCVEVAALGPQIAVRDSKNPDGAALVFGPDAWRGLLSDLKR